jgi:hypothetical protein
MEARTSIMPCPISVLDRLTGDGQIRVGKPSANTADRHPSIAATVKPREP